MKEIHKNYALNKNTKWKATDLPAHLEYSTGFWSILSQNLWALTHILSYKKPRRLPPGFHKPKLRKKQEISYVSTDENNSTFVKILYAGAVTSNGKLMNAAEIWNMHTSYF